MLKGRAIGMLQRPLERRLSAALGARVTFGKLDVSLLGGAAVEAEDVAVIVGPDPAVPLLTIRKVRAEVSLAAALKKEFVVRSLTIEKPVITVVRGADGTLNLPRRAGQPPDTPGAQPDAAAANEEAAGTWTFEARKVLVVDGEIHYRDASGYHASVEQLLVEMKEADGGMELTLIADSAGRRDEPIELGQIRANGRAENVPSLADWARASIRGAVELADRLRVRLDVVSIKPLDVKAELNGAADVGETIRLLPPDFSPPAAIGGAAGLRGRVEVLGRATYRAGDGLRVPELTLRAADVILSGPARSTSSS